MKLSTSIKPIKLYTILGARPQFIKARALSATLKQNPYIHSPHATYQLQEFYIHTNQHNQANMSMDFFKELHLDSPTHTLPKAPNHLSRLEHVGFMFAKLKIICTQERPDLILVYGDTNSTLAGSLIAHFLKIPLIHIEAGLRSFNFNMPEEYNRIATDKLSTLLFCPTKQAYHAFKPKPHQKLYFSGDVMLDNVLFYQNHVHPPQGFSAKNFFFATLHRASNIDNPHCLRAIISALEELAQQIPVFLALHPRTAIALEKYNLSLKYTHILPPLSYLETLYMLKHARLVLTDSGGLQKEAYFCKTPVLILREESEYQALIEEGAGVLVGHDRARIIQMAVQSLKEQPKLSFASMHSFGEGHSASLILQAIKEHVCYLESLVLEDL
ncbi:non-hydrolyzing UDP-N-acetylglucosamine 2-epimerase [Helicobacter suis]|uniref:non-hydrolyzing UDP-N-acetylglucosamine 2-epimerase n=1 Tax=Helicobacter suis TaxID=104628 RepID=UPI0019680056|nr:UDP-N-acetylglucosamine 2-epimerase (non-hydrolyzing) [Helicobacter suis]